jgi:hypothetical protein
MATGSLERDSLTDWGVLKRKDSFHIKNSHMQIRLKESQRRLFQHMNESRK